MHILPYLGDERGPLFCEVILGRNILSVLAERMLSLIEERICKRRICSIVNLEVPDE